MQTCLNEGSVCCTNRSKYKTKMKAKNNVRTLIFNRGEQTFSVVGGGGWLRSQ